MTKFTYFNDTNKEVGIHPATQFHGTTCDMSPIKPLEIREFILPEGSYPWVKQWSNGTILVSPTSDDRSDNNKPKHIGKYPIEFSFTEKATGERLLAYLKEQMQTPDLDTPVYSMLSMIRNQVENHLRKDDVNETNR